MPWMEKLKQRWKVNSIWQVIIILIIFACTGFTVYLIKKPILDVLAGDHKNSTIASIVYYILILPLYNALLLAYGLIFGQFRFFWEFEKRFFNRIRSVFKKTKN